MSITPTTRTIQGAVKALGESISGIATAFNLDFAVNSVTIAEYEIDEDDDKDEPRTDSASVVVTLEGCHHSDAMSYALMITRRAVSLNSAYAYTVESDGLTLTFTID